MHHQATIRRVFLHIAIALAALLTLPAASAGESSPWPRLAPEVDPELETFVDDLLGRMSLEQKIGQILQAEIQFITPAEAHEFGIGAVLNGGGSFPDRDMEAPVTAWSELSAAFREASSRPMKEGLPAIPILWGTDAVHGHSNVFGATVYPHNIGLGAADDPALVEAIARATAADVAATGIDWNFAPAVSVAIDLRWGRTYESFSSDPQRVARLGRAAIVGFQGHPGADWLDDRRVLATAKHFVADGGTWRGIDQGDARMDEQRLFSEHGLPYVDALEVDVQTVMASFSSWNGLKMHAHHYLLTEVLKNTMGFDGFVIGDWNGHGQIPGCTVSDCVEALEAGVDMFMVPEDWRELRLSLLAHAESGRLPLERLDDAVRRILRVKARAGLFGQRPAGADALPDPEQSDSLARQAVRASLVLLKNNDSVLPLDPRGRILVVGDGADDIGKQSGGWTLEWQGVTETNASFPRGQSIFAGLAEQVAAAGGEIRLGEDGLGDFRPDAVIAVFGEDPYSEGRGDVTTLEYQPGQHADLELLQRMQALEVPVVSVFLSGRPLWVNPEINLSDAFIAAWLPGTQGGGVADVVLADSDGQVQHAPGATLPFAWPDHPLPASDGTLKPLFELGYGLTYDDEVLLGPLSEQGLTSAEDVDSEITAMRIFDGEAAAPWLLMLRSPQGEQFPVHGQTASAPWEADFTLAPTDFRLQGDARRVSWPGPTAGSLAFVGNHPVDLVETLGSDVALGFDLRLHAALPDGLTIALECGEHCTRGIALSDHADGTQVGQWQRVRIGLDCLVDDPAGLEAITGTFVLTSARAASLSFANVAFERNEDGAPTATCSR
ncbi:MAG: glycoside hydrolase family 3 N-terminal domain-containing protein [Wenzhouxiangellaceae bacterium]